MSASRIHHTGLTVSEMDVSLRFWRDALGAEVVLDQISRGPYLGQIVGAHGARGRAVHLRLPAGEERIELYQYHYPHSQSAVSYPARPIHVGFAHVAVTCSDVRALLRALVEAGGCPFGDPVRIDSGANEGALGVYIRDPDGHTLELIQPPGG